MDPNTTLSQLHAAIACADRDAAVELVLDLIDWIDRDGFLPDALTEGATR